MNWTSALAVYLLFWVFSAFLVLPFNIKTTEEVGGELIPGQAESAPHEFKPLRIGLWITAVATTGFAIFYYVYTNNVLDPQMFDFYPAR
jgi:predicted secreted protein